MNEPVILSISQMIDMAIGNPEVGVVDFNMLHTLLHCIVQQLKIEDKAVELRGGSSQPMTRPPNQTVAVHEFAVDAQAGTMKEISPPPPKKDDTILVAEKIRSETRQQAAYAPPSAGGQQAGYGPPTPGGQQAAYGPPPLGGQQTAYGPPPPGGQQAAYGPPSQGGQQVAYGPPQQGGPQGGQQVAYGPPEQGGPPPPGGQQAAYGPPPPGAYGGGVAPPSQRLQVGEAKTVKTPSGTALSVVSVSKFNLLADAVDDLRSKVYSTLPKNKDILEGVRTASNEKAITDMWSTLNVQGRLDAAENGIAKLSSLVEDLIKETPELQRHKSKIARAAEITADVMTPRSQAQAAAAGMAYGPGEPGAPGMVYGPAQPGAQGMVYGPGQPGAQGMLYGPGQPGVQGMAYGPGQPGAQGIAYGPGQPGVPGQLGAEGMAYGPEQPGAQSQPGAQGVAYGPGQPGAQGIAYGSGQTGTPGQPGVPGMAAPSPPVVPPAMSKFAEYADPQGGFANMDSGDVQAIAQNVKDLRTDLDNLYVTFYRTMEDNGIDTTDTGALPSPALANAMVNANKQIQQDAAVQEVIGARPGSPGAQSVPGAPTYQIRSGSPGATRPSSPGAAYGGRGFRGGRDGAARFDPSDIYEKLLELERKMNKCCQNIDRNGSNMMDKIDRLEDQVDYVLKQMGVNTGEIQKRKDDPNIAAKDLQGLMALFNTVQEMQEQLKNVHNTAMQLAAEKEQRAHHINTLLEQVELLKIIKLDREDMAEAMAAKADVRMLARKVSHDQFEMACDDLAKGLEHAISKLNMQEALWQQALDDIQREIETKLDKMELSPVKEFFNNKLKMLQENLRQLAQLRREVEAAGTKRKLLKDVNCISCDAKVVMAMENGPCLPGNRPVTAMHSMKPYLTYELDSIRKMQSSNLPQRNMHDWETIDKEMGHQKPLQKVRSETDKHICNRYCGGSHTVTTPAQRVARTGHFVKQWGPDVLPLSSGLAAGDDGKMYKVTNVEVANVGPGGPVETICTPKPQKKTSDIRPPRPIIISNECRCLEGGDRVTKDGKDAYHPKDAF